MSKRLKVQIVATAVVSGVLLVLQVSAALGGSEAPVNDNFLAATNLNDPQTPLNSTATLGDITDTVGATLQSNILSPCGSAICADGSAELNSCDGVSYGKTVWYDFYPDHDGQVEIRTTGIPNVIALYSYNPFSLVPTAITCEPGSIYPSNELFAYVHAGVYYTYQIGGRNSVGGDLRMRFNYAYQTALTVTPFRTAPIFSLVSGQPQATRLVGLRFIGLARGEQVSAECQACGGAAFGHQVTSANAIRLSSDRPVAVGPRTRVVVGAWSPAHVGRFKVYAVDPAGIRLVVRSVGCLAPGTASVPASNTYSCPAARLVNRIGAEYVFWEGANDRLWEKWYSGTSWHGPIPVQVDKLGSVPAVAVHADGQQDVFWKGTNGKLWETWYTGQWNQPVDLGGGTLGSAPAVGLDSSGDEYVFWQGTDHRLWEMSYSAGSWSQSIPLLAAGELGSAPAVAVHSNGEQDVFWRGANGHLWETWFTGVWNRAVDLGGGQLGSAPSVAIDGAGNEYVFWRGADGGLWEKAYVDGRWARAVSVRAGVLGSAPVVAVHANGEQDVFWKGTNGNLWESWHTGRWHGPIDLGGGRLGSAPSAGVDAAGKQGTSGS